MCVSLALFFVVDIFAQTNLNNPAFYRARSSASMCCFRKSLLKQSACVCVICRRGCWPFEPRKKNKNWGGTKTEKLGTCRVGLAVTPGSRRLDCALYIHRRDCPSWIAPALPAAIGPLKARQFKKKEDKDTHEKVNIPNSFFSYSHVIVCLAVSSGCAHVVHVTSKHITFRKIPWRIIKCFRYISYLNYYYNFFLNEILRRSSGAVTNSFTRRPSIFNYSVFELILLLML